MTATVEISTSAEVAAILAALASIPGLTPSESAPDVPTEGAAWPRWTETRYLGGKLAARPVSTFEVVVILPAGYAPTTTAAAHEIRDSIAAALGSAGVVENVEPVLVAFGDGNDMPALRYRMTPRTVRGN